MRDHSRESGEPSVPCSMDRAVQPGVARQLGLATTVTVNYVGWLSHRLDVGGHDNPAPTPGPGNPRVEVAVSLHYPDLLGSHYAATSNG
jgi:hypothetical protein